MVAPRVIDGIDERRNIPGLLTKAAHGPFDKAKKTSKAPRARTAAKMASATTATKLQRTKTGRMVHPKVESSRHARGQERSATPGSPALREGTKLALLVDMLRRAKGVTLDELVQA